MTVSSSAALLPSPPRINASPDRLTIWDADLFQEPEKSPAKEFLARVFTVREVTEIEIHPRGGFVRLRYETPIPTAEVLRKIQRALILSATPRPSQASRPSSFSKDPSATEFSRDIECLFLETPPEVTIRVARLGGTVSTWRVRRQTTGRVRLTHPLLRNRKDIAYRLEEELTAILGVRDFKTRLWSGSVTVRFNPQHLSVERLLRRLEIALPRLIHGFAPPPSTRRFLVAPSIMTLAFTGQFFVPALLPFALTAVAIYGSANVLQAVKQLFRGKIGLPALYTGTLTFTLLSGMPFSASLMATFMQTWPRMATKTLVRSQRRLFATHRQRSTWARLQLEDGLTVEVDIETLKPGSVIVVKEGEVVPVDGVVIEGLAAVDEEALSGRAGAFDKAPGDTLYAASFVRAGIVSLRVTRLGEATLAGSIGAQLPHGRLENLPSAAASEKLANTLVAPTLALSGLNLLLTGVVQPSQSTLRPDYATGPRISAQLATLFELGDGLRRGILFRNPASIHRLPTTDIYVFDDSEALTRREIHVGEIIAAPGVSRETVLSFAASAFPTFQNMRARALFQQCVLLRVSLQEISERQRKAGVVSYRDTEASLVEIAAPGYLTALGTRIPSSVAAAVAASSSAWARREDRARKHPAIAHEESQLRPLWVIRDGKVLGVVTFQRSGDLEGLEVIATLKARNSQATFLHLSSDPQEEAVERARQIGISTVFGGLSSEEKGAILSQLGDRTMWIGDGSSPDSASCIEAAAISISVGGASTVPHDEAGVVFLQPSLRNLVPLRRIGRRHRAVLKDATRGIFTTNLLSLAGAFFAGFDTLAVALLSNTGTGYIYSSHRTMLDELVSRMESKMTLDSTRFENEEHDGTDNGAQEQETHERFSAYESVSLQEIRGV